MPLHSYTRCWLHMVWATLDRRPLLSKPAAAKLSGYLTSYACEKAIYMKINFVNADPVHALVDLPASRAIDEVAQLLKGSSSHWLNESNPVPGKFPWQRGNEAFPFSISAVSDPAKYIVTQDGNTKCVSCQLCEFVCPPKAIRIVPPGPDGPPADRPNAEKIPKEFEINMLRCIFCGYCQEVCPEEAIFLMQDYSLTGTCREE